MATAGEVVVQLSTSQGHGAARAPGGALDCLRERFGLTARPMYPGADDASLLDWYTVAVPAGAGADAEDVAAALRERPDVDAAYVKPPAELP
ncbi:hypothetical protein ACWGJ2_30250 [Streptomyces sp. NPDC054796]